MKKALVLILIFAICILSAFFLFFKPNEEKISENISEIINEKTNSLMSILKNQNTPKYEDKNEMKIGLYTDEGDKKKLVSDYYCDFSAENIMGLFYAIPSDEETIPGYDFKEVFDSYYTKYEDYEKYKIGYNIKFTMEDGSVIDETILDPDDAYFMFPEVQFYLYDDINLIPGRSYYHITQDIMNDERICSSVKLVGDKRTKNIISPIELTVFTFDGKDDFDEITKKYRGNSYYTIRIYESN